MAHCLAPEVARRFLVQYQKRTDAILAGKADKDV
jgi:hypothetical protein